MATGSITVTPGKQFDTINGEVVDLPKLNQLGNPTARVDENTIGRRELITAFVTQVDDATAAITQEIIDRADGDTALAATITTLTATVDGNTAAITAEATARANGDSALSATITSLTATVNSNTAAITAEATARANGDSALSSTITSLTATVNSNTAAITAEATARANGDSALSSTISSLTATVNGNTAAITTEATARATADGNLAGKYTLTATAGNVVTGLNITSASGPGTTVSVVAFQADRFAINTSSGGNKEVFSATSTQVKLGGVLTVDVANTKVFLGAGNYNNADTGFYVDASGKFSLKDKLTWNGSTLSINGGGTFSGALSAATGTFAGALSAATGTFAGSLSAATGTFAGSLSAATGTFNGSIDVGSGLFRTTISGSGAVFGATAGNYVDINNLGGAAGIRLVDSTGTVQAQLLTLPGTSLLTCQNISASGITTGSDVTFGGKVTARSITARAGIGGATGNELNNFWSGSTLQAWVDVSHVGDYLFRGAYTGSTVTHSGYVEMKDDSGTTRKFMIGA